MKPSHLQTPRTLAETTFTTGYACSPMSDKPSFSELAGFGLIGIFLFAGLLACMLAYFDVLVP